MDLDFDSDGTIEAAHRFAGDGRGSRSCGDCAAAQLFAVQPRALCTRREGALAGRTLFAGQPACGDFVRLDGADVRLSVYTADLARPRTYAEAV